MKQSSLHHTLIGAILLLAIVACVLPSQPTPLAPETNSNLIETAVVGTSQAAEQQTQQANSVPPTATLVAADTPTPTPKISVSGTSLIVRDDQSTLFIDHKAGFQLIVPDGWMALRLNEEEYFKAFDSDIVLQNPDIFERLTFIRDLNPDRLRLDAIDIRPGHTTSGILTLINVIFQSGDTRSLERWEQAERDRYRPLAGFKFLSSTYPQLANGTRVLVIEQSWADNGGRDTVYYRGVFFSLPSGTVVLDFYTNNNFKETVLPDFDQVINSLTVLNP